MKDTPAKTKKRKSLLNKCEDLYSNICMLLKNLSFLFSFSILHIFRLPVHKEIFQSVLKISYLNVLK